MFDDIADIRAEAQSKVSALPGIGSSIRPATSPDRPVYSQAGSSRSESQRTTAKAELRASQI